MKYNLSTIAFAYITKYGSFVYKIELTFPKNGAAGFVYDKQKTKSAKDNTLNLINWVITDNVRHKS